MDIRIINYSTKDYDEMIILRITALLEPIGVSASYINKENEKKDIFLGAYEGQQLIGCCVLTKRDENMVQLRQMAVSPAWQGKKIGARILHFAEQVARQHSFNTLMMHARDPVIDFYKKCGYHITGTQFFEVGIGHHRMEKAL